MKKNDRSVVNPTTDLNKVSSQLVRAANVSGLSWQGRRRKREYELAKQESALQVMRTVEVENMKAVGDAAVTAARAASSLKKAEVLEEKARQTVEHKKALNSLYNDSSQAYSERTLDAVKSTMVMTNEYKSSLDSLAEEGGLSEEQLTLLKQTADAVATADAQGALERMNVIKESDRVAFERISENAVFEQDQDEDDFILDI